MSSDDRVNTFLTALGTAAGSSIIQNIVEPTPESAPEPKIVHKPEPVAPKIKRKSKKASRKAYSSSDSDDDITDALLREDKKYSTINEDKKKTLMNCLKIRSVLRTKMDENEALITTLKNELRSIKKNTTTLSIEEQVERMIT